MNQPQVVLSCKSRLFGLALTQVTPESEPEVDLSTIQMKRRVASRSPSHSPPKRRKVTPPQLSGKHSVDCYHSVYELRVNRLVYRIRIRTRPQQTSRAHEAEGLPKQYQ